MSRHEQKNDGWRESCFDPKDHLVVSNIGDEVCQDFNPGRRPSADQEVIN